METPEDVATEECFTPATLTDMLRTEAFHLEDIDEGATIQVEEAKNIFKEWLRTVGLPCCYPTVEDGIRQLLITLVDEP